LLLPGHIHQAIGGGVGFLLVFGEGEFGEVDVGGAFGNAECGMRNAESGRKKNHPVCRSGSHTSSIQE